MNPFIALISSYNSLSEKLYVVLRWLVCPFDRMEKLIPKRGTIVDVGCGEGVLSIFLAITSDGREIIGIDLNKRRIETARRASYKYKNTSFMVQSAVALKIKSDCIIVSDVFHHLSSEDQLLFLKITHRYLKKNGLLVIKEINKDDRIRAPLSRIWDLIFYPKDQINYWTEKKLKHKLNSLGFKVKVKREALYFPGSTLLYICTKK